MPVSEADFAPGAGVGRCRRMKLTELSAHGLQNRHATACARRGTSDEGTASLAYLRCWAGLSGGDDGLHSPRMRGAARGCAELLRMEAPPHADADLAPPSGVRRANVERRG